MTRAPRYRLGRYLEYAPPGNLAGVADGAWVYARGTGASRAHRVLPDPGVSLSFRCGRDEKGRVHAPALLLIGTVLTPRRFDPPSDVCVAALRIRPELCRDLFGIDPGEHFDAETDLAEVDASGSARLLDRLAGTRSSGQALEVLAEEVRRRGADRDVSRGSVLAHAGLERMRCRPGATLGLDAVARELDVSRRHLRRLVRDRTGLSPKRLQRLRRLCRAVMAADRVAEPRWSRLALNAGFYDQSHMIGAFKDLTGRTPVRLHRERRRQVRRPTRPGVSEISKTPGGPPPTIS